MEPARRRCRKIGKGRDGLVVGKGSTWAVKGTGGRRPQAVLARNVKERCSCCVVESGFRSPRPPYCGSAPRFLATHCIPTVFYLSAMNEVQ